MNVARRSKDLQAVRLFAIKDETDPSQKLIDLKLGVGAAVLPLTVQRIDLNFASKINNGHMGARKVWREILPRLKYHNPGLVITVTRHADNAGPAEMTITSSTGPTSEASPEASTTVKKLDMRHRTHTDVFDMLLSITGASRYQPTPRELAERDEVTENNLKRSKDRERQTRLNETIKREASLLEQARSATS